MPKVIQLANDTRQDRPDLGGSYSLKATLPHPLEIWGKGCGSPELIFQVIIFFFFFFLEQSRLQPGCGALRRQTSTCHLGMMSGPNPVPSPFPLASASLTKHSNYRALLPASKASPGSPLALAVVNLRSFGLCRTAVLGHMPTTARQAL